MASHSARIEDDAIDWLIRVNAPDFGDWAELEAWMAQSPDHAAAFNRLSALDDAVTREWSAPAVLPTPVQDEAPQDRSARVGWAAAFAAIAAVVLFWFLQPSSAIILQTAPGETLQIALDDGVTVILNGATRIDYDRDAPRRVVLTQGEALFNVRNGRTKPFEVVAGGRVMRDLGTTFNVIQTKGITQLSVSQGKVMFDNDGAKLPVKQGQAIRYLPAENKVERFAVAPDSVSGWRTGELVYHNASLSQIAEDVSRQLGVPVQVSPAARAIRFTGLLQISGDDDASMAGIAPLLGVDSRKQGASWVLDVHAR
jgi:transmembrane sensor